MKTSVIFPARNEEKLIKEALLDVYRHLKKKKYTFEILVVANGCTDKTEEIIKTLSKKYPQIKLLKSKPGYGYALRKGLESAVGDYVVIFNVDFYETELLDFVDIELIGKDLIIGSKSTYWSEDKRPVSRRVVTKFFNLFLRFFYGFKGSDTHGIKVIRGEVVKNILKTCKTHTGIFDSEFVIKAQRSNYKIMDYPVKIFEKRLPRFVGRLIDTPKDLIKLNNVLK